MKPESLMQWGPGPRVTMAPDNEGGYFIRTDTRGNETVLSRLRFIGLSDKEARSIVSGDLTVLQEAFRQIGDTRTYDVEHTENPGVAENPEYINLETVRQGGRYVTHTIVEVHPCPLFPETAEES